MNYWVTIAEVRCTQVVVADLFLCVSLPLIMYKIWIVIVIFAPLEVFESLLPLLCSINHPLFCFLCFMTTIRRFADVVPELIEEFHSFNEYFTCHSFLCLPDSVSPAAIPWCGSL